MTHPVYYLFLFFLGGHLVYLVNNSLNPTGIFTKNHKFIYLVRLPLSTVLAVGALDTYPVLMRSVVVGGVEGVYFLAESGVLYWGG